MRRLYLLLFFISLAPDSNAQEKLSLQEAIQIALEKNYNIQLVSKDLEIAANNVYVGNAGMLPSVQADFSKNSSIQNSTQTLLGGDTRSVVNGKNQSMSYGASLDWTIFDGFRMFSRYEQLKTVEELGKAYLKQEILVTINEVIRNYYNLINLEQQLNAFVTAVELSTYRYETANNRYQIGRASKLEVLAAKVDLNSDTTKLLYQENLIQNSKTRLNELLVRDPQYNFVVTDSISINSTLQRDDLLKTAQTNNPEIKIALINMQLSELQLKEVKGARYPVFNARTNYTISNSSTELGFATNSRGKGFNYGLTASVNIFNGLRQRRNEQNSKILIEQNELSLEKVNSAIATQLTIAYQTYLTNLKLANFEERNVSIAKDNLDITLEKFTIGTIAPIEYREAQRNYTEATVRLNESRYEAKLAEVALKQISGTLDFF